MEVEPEGGGLRYVDVIVDFSRKLYPAQFGV